MTMVGIKDTDTWENHTLPHATHELLSESIRFWVEFYGSADVVADEVYLLYDGQTLVMDLYVGDGASGFYNFSVSPLPSECEPYAFIAKDTNGDWWRLPEDERYYFATVGHPDNLIDGSAGCDENHYFYTGTQWVANGAYNLTNSKNYVDGCVGCDKVSALETEYASADVNHTVQTNEPLDSGVGCRSAFGLVAFVFMSVSLM